MDGGADSLEATVVAVLGPTNTGKTHYAIERMLGHATGCIGLPLRLLAREVYDRIVAVRGARSVALITGEEKITPANAPYVVATVESMPLDWGFDFVAVDEIQLCADADRGHVFTDRLLHARGRHETLLLGAETMRGRIQQLIPKARFTTRQRFSTLSYAGSKKLSRLPARSAVVGFSADGVYAMAELIRRQRGGAAVVMGALSPRTRNAQVALYQNGEVDFLVATDAIGMGLNLDVKHVAFAGLSKFDGRRHRRLEAQELAQIAGRAGRHMTDGSFGVTGEAPPLDADLVEAIQEHRFDPIRTLQWRNSALDMRTVPALLASLEAGPEQRGLIRAREADDMQTLRALWADDEISRLAVGGAAVRRLWDVCQIPDFRKTMASEHAALLGRIYRFLVSDEGAIPSDWIAEQVRRVDRVDGDIDALSKRLAYIRTWTYVANRGGWLEEAAEWRERTRAVEDKLSDALHARLTQRFVDRRTSVLMRRLKQKESLVAEVNQNGEVSVEGQFVGRLDGFRFRADESATGAEARTLKSASLQALGAQIGARIDRFYNSPDTEMDVTEQGGLMWGDAAVGRLEPGGDILSPQVKAFVDDDLDKPLVEKVERRLSHWITRRVAALFEPIVAMRDDEALTGLAKGVAFQLVNALGVIPRREIADDVKALSQEERGMLRKHGVRFGQHTVFMPLLLKPAPTRLRIVLWGLWEKLEDIPAPPPPGLVTIPSIEGAPNGFYERAGYRRCNARAVRIDMLERLADMIRPMDQRAGFEATPDMLSITGCTLEQFADIMEGMSFKAERGERPKPARVVETPDVAKPEQADTVAEAGETASTTADNPAAEPETSAPGVEDAEKPPETDAPEAAGSEASPAEPAGPETASPETAMVEPVPEPPADVPAPDAPEGEPAEPATERAAEDKPAPDPDEVEVFFTFTYAPRRRREAPPRQGRDAQDPDAKPERRGPRRSGKPDGPKGDRKANDGKEAKRKGGKPNRNRREDERKPKEFRAGPQKARVEKVDPDSPFAILQQLKDKK